MGQPSPARLLYAYSNLRITGGATHGKLATGTSNVANKREVSDAKGSWTAGGPAISNVGADGLEPTAHRSGAARRLPLAEVSQDAQCPQGDPTARLARRLELEMHLPGMRCREPPSPIAVALLLE